MALTPGVVAAVLEVEALDDEGARVLVVAPDRDRVRDGPVLGPRL
jgi:hypothetical protein